jgi:hypothetical protein
MRRPPTAAGALRHPAFAAALLLLLVNDHLLKGSGVLPGLVTGKLSDFAGLVVAPLVLAGIFEALHLARGRRALVLSSTAVGAWFIAVNLSPAFSAHWDRGMGLFGVPWHLTPDPTDLVALVAVPLPFALLRGARPAPMPRAALAAGAIACLATGGPSFYETQAYLLNTTEEELEVRVRPLEASVDCAVIDGRMAEALAPAAFGPATTYAVGPGEILPLDEGQPPGRFDDGFEVDEAEAVDAPLDPCRVVLVDIAGGVAPQIVRWSTDERRVAVIDVGEPLSEGEAADALRVVRTASGLGIENTPPGIQRAVLRRIHDPGVCPTYGEPTAFDAAGFRNGAYTLAAIESLPGGCVSLELSSDLEETSGILCVPREDIPFRIGDRLGVVGSQSALRITADDPLASAPLASLWLLPPSRFGAGTFQVGPFEGAVVPNGNRCRGERLECGAFATPAMLALPEGGTTLFVHPGEAFDRVVDGTHTERLRVARAALVDVGQSSCPIPFTSAGTAVQALHVTFRSSL